MANFVAADFFPRSLAYGAAGATAVRGGGGRHLLLHRLAAALAEGHHVSCHVGCAAEAEAVRQALTEYGPVAGFSPELTPADPAPPCFGPHDFAAVVGLWLDHAGGEAAQLLSPYISREGFDFTPGEFVELRDRIQAAIRHYTRLPGVASALEDLNTGLFRFQELEESRAFVGERLACFRTQAHALHRRYLLAIHRYARASHFSALAELREESRALEELAIRYETVRKQEGRSARRHRQQWLQDVRSFRLKYASGARKEIDSLDDFPEILAETRDRISQKLRELPRQLQSEGLGLSAVTTRPERIDPAELSRLQEELTALIREIDEAGLYQLPVAGQEAATTPRQLKVLEQLIHRLDTTHRHLPEYDDFYRRRQFWYAQPAPLRRLLGPLTELPTADWDAAFQAWYLERCLQQGEQLPPAPLDPEELLTVAEQWMELERLPRAAWVDRLHFNDHPEAALTVDLTGSGRGDLQWLPATERTAAAPRLGGLRQSELVFQQPFVALRPPDFRPGTPAELAAATGETGPCFRARTDQALDVLLPQSADYEGADGFVADWPRCVVRGSGLVIHHDWSPGAVTDALLSDGLTARFLAAVLIRSLEYATADPFDAPAYMALGAEVRGRYQLGRDDRHPLAESVARLLRVRLPNYFLETHVAWRDGHLPLVVTAPTGRKTVLLPQGRLTPYSPDLVTEALRQRELRLAGFGVEALDAWAFWQDAGGAVEALAGRLTST